MALFLPSGELLSSINFIPSPHFFSYSLVFLLGGIALFGITLFLLSKKFFRLKFKLPVLSLIIVAWLPLGLYWFYDQSVEFVQALELLRKDEMSQLRHRACQIESHSSFGNALCNLPIFVQLIYQEMPLKSQIFIADSDLRPFLEYLLSSDYVITDDEEIADYIVIYFPTQAFYIDNEGNTYVSSRDNNFTLEKSKVLGKFEIITAVNQNVLILKPQP